MEVLVILIIVIVLCLVLNVSLQFIILGLVAFIGIVSGIFAVAFLLCIACLLKSQKKVAVFERIGRVKDSRFQVAFYLVDGKEYPCIFPKEAILESKLYRKDRNYLVMLHEKTGKVFDRFAVVTCILGFAAGLVLSMGSLSYCFVEIFGRI